MKELDPSKVLAKYASEVEKRVRAENAKLIKELKNQLRRAREYRTIAVARNRELRTYITQYQKQISELRSDLRKINERT